jgi:hypothetical protein
MYTAQLYEALYMVRMGREQKCEVSDCPMKASREILIEKGMCRLFLPLDWSKTHLSLAVLALTWVNTYAAQYLYSGPRVHYSDV